MLYLDYYFDYYATTPISKSVLKLCKINLVLNIFANNNSFKLFGHRCA